MESTRRLTLFDDELDFLFAIVLGVTEFVGWGEIDFEAPTANLTSCGVLRFLLEVHDAEDHDCSGSSIEVLLIPPAGYTKDYQRWWEVPGFRSHVVLSADCPITGNKHLVWETRDNKGIRQGFCPSCRRIRLN